MATPAAHLDAALQAVEKGLQGGGAAGVPALLEGLHTLGAALALLLAFCAAGLHDFGLIGFGGGTHHCLGHFIARGDMTAALALLASRMKNPRFNGEVKWLPDSGNTGAISMPIAFDRA